MPSRLPALIAIGLVALACTACGRRGGLQPPGTASPRGLPTTSVGDRAAAPDPDAVQAGDELSPAAIPPGGDGVPVTTNRGGKRGYRIPKEPFILDAIL
ncbi:hypothetical protein ASG52_20965 [Methylobacterium sp. Leaf456]|uniref:hypothetical protein n=1 Tax=Methylobacterium sp. Leaf456 TaxID=1736382 RepID=UPI0006F5F215|nr:hypothetical protein [Methylobacterium sp. Leaf456]KQT58609.1 hypothetical protein ASG52_20965 [Methylobacterium sp. Leaf456]